MRNFKERRDAQAARYTLPRDRLMAKPLKGQAVLFSEMTPAADDERRFNDWYDNHHTPSHVQGVPGFLSAHRYAAPDGPGYCAVYELDGPAALETEEYRSRKHTPDERTRSMLASVTGYTRYVGREIGFLGDPETALDAEILLAVFFAVPVDRQAAFLDWYAGEHAPMLVACPGWLMARTMEVIDHNPDPFTHMILHYHAHEGVRRAPEAARAHDTAWRKRLAAEPWYTPRSVMYRKRGERFLKSG